MNHLKTIEYYHINSNFINFSPQNWSISTGIFLLLKNLFYYWHNHFEWSQQVTILKESFLYCFFRPYLILIRLWWRCLLWYMTYEICQPIIRHSYDSELFLYQLNRTWGEVLIKRTSNIQKNGYYATSYIWGMFQMNIKIRNFRTTLKFLVSLKNRHSN